MAEIKNLKKLAQRILEAINPPAGGQKEKIILFGDSDMDGACAVIILKEAICSLGGNSPIIYFSDRKREEHGINRQALEFLKAESPALFIALDCGISNFKEVDLAKKFGFEVVIIDHHDILRKKPKAKIIINPKQGKKDSPFYYLAASGIVFKLAEEMLGKNVSKTLRQDILSLAALATFTDFVPEIGENQKILEEGLPILENSWRPAIRFFFISDLTKKCISTREIIWKIISIINITDKEGVLNEIYLFLISHNLEEAESRFAEFLRKASERQAKISRAVEELKARISFQDKNQLIIFEGLDDYPFPFVSAVAGRVSNFFKKPTFIFTREKKENWGAFNMPFKENGVEALTSCARFLRRYGGHPPVGGFYFEDKNSGKLKQCLIKYFTP